MVNASSWRAPDLVYICDWLPPDFGAVGQYAMHFVQEHAAAGARVVLIGLCSTVHSDETIRVDEGWLRIIKIRTASYDKSKRLARLWWTAKTNTRLLATAWPLLRRAAVIKFTGSPPFFLHWIAPANLLLHKELVYRITDFHPECIIAERGKTTVLLDALLALTLMWRRRVHRYEVLGYDQARRLSEIGIGNEAVVLKRDPSPVAITAETQPLPRPLEANDKTLLLYSGNWGVAHDEATFVAAYEAHHRDGSGRVLLWLNALGSQADVVRRELRRRRLPFIDSKLVPLAQLAGLLVTPDAHLITLHDRFVGYVLPSKVYGCVASGKPIVFIGSAESDVHRVCIEADMAGYQRVAVGDSVGLLRALENLADTVENSNATCPDVVGNAKFAL